MFRFRPKFPLPSTGKQNFVLSSAEPVSPGLYKRFRRCLLIAEVFIRQSSSCTRNHLNSRFPFTLPCVLAPLRLSCSFGWVLFTRLVEHQPIKKQPPCVEGVAGGCDGSLSATTLLSLHILVAYPSLRLSCVAIFWLGRRDWLLTNDLLGLTVSGLTKPL